MKNFALIGAAGYIAPRHMQAIRETGNTLLAALDPNDSVGILDSYFPDASFFTEFERFDRHLHELRRAGQGVEYFSICSPNYLHDPHIRIALRSRADVICEKPLVLTPESLDEIASVERETGRRVNSILQLRVHPTIIRLRDQVASSDPATRFDVDLTYITSRGRWYFESWKGDERKSGGVASNIGVHFFDMLHFVFGSLTRSEVHLANATRASGYLEFDRARVRWFLSLNLEDVPKAQRSAGQRTYRSITLNGDEVEFSDGFTGLHTLSYQEVLAGRGFGLEDNRMAIETVAAMRRASTAPRGGDYHPLLKGLAE